MRRRTLLLSGIGLLNLSVTLPARAHARTAGPRKRALLIGVSGYAARGWQPLNTDKDVKAIRDALIRKLGFLPEDIRTLTSPEETRHAAIVRAIEKLIAETQPGDIVYVHYSGHGSHDEDRAHPGAYVQSLVPSDTLSKQDSSNNIRVSELKALWEKLKTRRPVNLTLTFDACFSGALARGRMVARGQSRTRPSALPPRPAEPLVSTKDAPADRGYIVLTAARSDLPAYECQSAPMGLFSYAFSKALLEARPKTTYRELFERIQSLIAQDNGLQTPEIAGRVDTALFGTEVIPPADYFPLDVVNKQVVLKAGLLHGVTAGSKFNLFPRDADVNHDTPVAIGMVGQPGDTETVLSLDRANVPLEQMHSGRATVKELALAADTLRVDASGIAAHPRADAIRKALGELEKQKMITTRLTDASAWNIRVVPAPVARGGASPAPGSLQLLTEHGTPLQLDVAAEKQDPKMIDVLPNSPALPDQVKLLLKNASRWRRLSSIHNSDPAGLLGVKVHIVPLEVERDAAGKPIRDSNQQPHIVGRRPVGSGRLTLEIGDFIAVDLENVGKLPVHVTLLDLSNDGKVSAWPHPQYPMENLIQPGETVRARLTDKYPIIWEITEPTGIEIFKAIATEKPVNFSRLVTDPNARRQRGGMNALERVFASTMEGERGNPQLIPSASWQTFDATFTIAPRKSRNS